MERLFEWGSFSVATAPRRPHQSGRNDASDGKRGIEQPCRSLANPDLCGCYDCHCGRRIQNVQDVLEVLELFAVDHDLRGQRSAQSLPFLDQIRDAQTSI